jgi:arylsulfatase A-like enzyme
MRHGRSCPALVRSARASLVALACLFAVPSCGRPGPPPRYNVLLISLDTVRRDVLGCYGRRPVHAPGTSPTPNLDALARDGVLMQDAYAPSSWTLPSHLSMMTGEPPLVHGVDYDTTTLDPATPTLAEMLQHAGYRTAGVYSAPYLEPHWGFGRGFEDYQAAYGSAVVEASARSAALRARIDAAAAAGDWARYDDLRRAQVTVDDDLFTIAHRDVTSDQVTRAVLAAIDGKDARPWFVFAHYFDPHYDYVPPPPYDTRFDPDYTGTLDGRGFLTNPRIARRDPTRPDAYVREIGDRDLEHLVALYEGEVAWVDEHLGTIFHALDARGETARTLVIVVADHGEEFFEHGGIGHHRTLFEESVRVPLLLRLPGVLPAGASVAGLVSVTDVFPTVLEIVGLPRPATASSSSFLSLVRGKEDPRARTMLYRLATLFTGEVQVDRTTRVPLRQVTVEDVFRTGPLKLTRTRSWPQPPAGLPANVGRVLGAEVVAQHGREALRWIDVVRAPAEPDAAASTDFSDPAARAALERFRREYAESVAARHAAHPSPVPEGVRRALQGLGYVDTGGGPAFPEPDVVLPAPGDA